MKRWNLKNIRIHILLAICVASNLACLNDKTSCETSSLDGKWKLQDKVESMAIIFNSNQTMEIYKDETLEGIGTFERCDNRLVLHFNYGVFYAVVTADQISIPRKDEWPMLYVKEWTDRPNRCIHPAGGGAYDQQIYVKGPGTSWLPDFTNGEIKKHHLLTCKPFAFSALSLKSRSGIATMR